MSPMKDKTACKDTADVHVNVEVGIRKTRLWASGSEAFAKLGCADSELMATFGEEVTGRISGARLSGDGRHMNSGKHRCDLWPR